MIELKYNSGRNDFCSADGMAATGSAVLHQAATPVPVPTVNIFHISDSTSERSAASNFSATWRRVMVC
jgi:hypothetical protein